MSPAMLVCCVSGFVTWAKPCGLVAPVMAPLLGSLDFFALMRASGFGCDLPWCATQRGGPKPFWSAFGLINGGLLSI